MEARRQAYSSKKRASDQYQKSKFLKSKINR